MNPVMGGTGHSFKGIFEYLFHDKGKDTSERVEWSHFHNLPTNDPTRARNMMIDLAKHADELKKNAGISNAGRKSNAHVGHYCLSWAVGEEVDEKTMLATCQESLKVLNAQRHQAAFIRHNDTDQVHAHIVFNRVDPENGKLLTFGNNFLKMSKWALDINARHGWKECEARIENNKKREKGEFVKHHEQATRKEYMEEKARGFAFWKQVMRDKHSHSDKQLAERKALFEAKEQKIKEANQQIKAEYKPQWRDLFKAQQAEMRQFKKETHEKFCKAKALMEYRIKYGQTHGLSQNFHTVLDREALFTTTATRHEAERKNLSGEQRNQTRQAFKQINQSYKADRLELLETQKEQQSEFDHSTYERIKEFNSGANDNEAQTNDQGRVRTLDHP